MNVIRDGFAFVLVALQAVPREGLAAAEGTRILFYSSFSSAVKASTPSSLASLRDTECDRLHIGIDKASPRVLPECGSSGCACSYKLVHTENKRTLPACTHTSALPCACQLLLERRTSFLDNLGTCRLQHV